MYIHSLCALLGCPSIHLSGGMGATLPLDKAIRRDPRWPSTRAVYGGVRGNLVEGGSYYEITACHAESCTCLIRLVIFCVSRQLE